MWLGIDYATQIWIYRVLVWVAPIIVFFAVRRVSRELLAGERAQRLTESVRLVPPR